MPGTGAISRQTNQGNIMNGLYPDAKFGSGLLVNGPNPDAESRSGLLKEKIGAGAEISLELAGQNREFIAQLVGRILREEFKNFGLESEELVGATMEAIQEIGFGPDTDLTLIVREVQSRTMPFTQEAAELFERTLKRAQEILNSSSTIAANNPSSNFPGFGPTPTSLGPALTA